MTQGYRLCLLVFVCFNGLLTANATILPEEDYHQVRLANGLRAPWAMAQLPNSHWVVTEREGNLVLINGSSLTRNSLNIPDLYVAGQGGLLDVVVAPDFATSGRLFISFSQGDSDANRLAVASVLLQENSISQPQPVFSINVAKDTPVHYAGRLQFMPDGTLLVTSGDGFDYREQAQVIDSHLGKILRINQDGSIPQDNPLTGEDGETISAVYSLGHRNAQGLVYVKATDTLYSHEHGPAGGDELNVITPGRNYGWPVITQGRDYSGARISTFTEYESMEQPVVNWTPSIAPSGMTHYSTSLNPKYKAGFASLDKHLLITTLVDQKMYAVDTQKGRYKVLPVFADVTGRLRDVKVAETGDIAVLTDGDDATLILLKHEESSGH